MEFQKIVNLLDTASDDKDLPGFVNKNGLKFIINQKEIYQIYKSRFMIILIYIFFRT